MKDLPINFMSSSWSSLLGVFIFTLLFILIYRIASGHWKVSPANEAKYRQWQKIKGKKVIRFIIVIAILYYSLMLFQLFFA
ncbi:hypothetical protein ACJD0Z_18305 [Flavobacteriaceae bacterium M23B6Z8]